MRSARVDALLDDTALARLWQAARDRLECTGLRIDDAAFGLRDLTDDERRGVSLLLGRAVRGRRVTVRLADLDSTLRSAGDANGLRGALERHGGALFDRPGARSSRAADEAAFWDRHLAHAAVRRHPGLADWLAQLRSNGWWKRAVAALDEPRLAVALDVLAALPSTIDRARLSSDITGDPHALDDAASVGRLVLSALAALSDGPPPDRADARRALWRRFGVDPDPLASTVLVFGVRPTIAGPVTDAVARLADAGMPLHVSVEMLRAEAWEIRAPRVFVCENPSVLRAAARECGASCAAIVCTEGMPSAACRRLFDVARSGGAELLYHGDFGAGGVRIGNLVIGDEGARPWRFGAADYRRAIEAGAAGTRIKGDVPDAVWDPRLAEELRATGIEIHEEQVIDDLVADVVAALDQ